MGGVLQPHPDPAARRVRAARTAAPGRVVAAVPAHPSVRAADHLRRSAAARDGAGLPAPADLRPPGAVVGDTAPRPGGVTHRRVPSGPRTSRNPNAVFNR